MELVKIVVDFRNTPVADVFLKEYVKEFTDEKSFNDYKDNNLLIDCGRIIGRCVLDIQFIKIEVVDKIQLNIDILDADNFVINHKCIASDIENDRYYFSIHYYYKHNIPF